MIGQCLMAILAGIVDAAAGHLDSDDVERGAVMDAASLRIHFHASDLGSSLGFGLGFSRLHMFIKTQYGQSTIAAKGAQNGAPGELLWRWDSIWG